MSYRKKLTDIKNRLVEILEEEFEMKVDESAIADELDNIMDSLDEVEVMFESNSLDDFDENLYKKILSLRREIIEKYDFFDPEIERERIDEDYAGYFDDENED